jgi:hypothetical protein
MTLLADLEDFVHDHRGQVWLLLGGTVAGILTQIIIALLKKGS